MSTIAAGTLLAAAKVWHFWMSVFLIVPVVLIVLLLGLGYLVRVVAQRYPRQ